MSNQWPKEDMERLFRRIRDIRGASFIEYSGFAEDSLNHFRIVYFQSFADFLRKRGPSGIRAKDFRLYFQTGAATEKILAIESMRLLREFPLISRISIIVPPLGDFVSIDLRREIAQSIFSFNPLDLNDATVWQTYVDRIGYDRDLRDRFLDRVGKRRKKEFY